MSNTTPFANPKVMTPAAVEVKPLNLDFITICTEVPLLAQFVHFCKRVNKASNKPDNVDAITETALASFFLLSRTPIEKFDELDLSELVKKTNSKIATATKAQHAIQAWQTRISEELVELESLMITTKNKLATACDGTIKDILDMKTKVTSTYTKAVDEVAVITQGIADDANMFNESFAETYSKDELNQEPKFAIRTDLFKGKIYTEEPEANEQALPKELMTPVKEDLIQSYFGFDSLQQEEDEVLRTVLEDQAAAEETQKPSTIPVVESNSNAVAAEASVNKPSETVTEPLPTIQEEPVKTTPDALNKGKKRKPAGKKSNS